MYLRGRDASRGGRAALSYRSPLHAAPAFRSLCTRLSYPPTLACLATRPVHAETLTPHTNKTLLSIMSGKGKGKGSKSTEKSTKSVKAGLQFPVARIGRYCKKYGYATRVGSVREWEKRGSGRAKWGVGGRLAPGGL